MKMFSTSLACVILCAAAAHADVAGQFDYYVLSLSWAPTWCGGAGDRDDTDQCAPGRRIGFMVHGLWPQNERGWPAECATGQPDPTRGDSREMADIMGSGGLAWYQWKKHGRCSGLSGRDYYRLTRAAAGAVSVPPLFAMLPRDITLPATVVEDAFMQANPALTRDGITVTCDGDAIDEVRVCLTRDLQPRDCAADARRDCRRKMLMKAPH